ncbi:MAG: endonuclease/exonuclease/phosphatase family protein [Enterovibrio sp.]
MMKKMYKRAAAVAISLALLTGCDSQSEQEGSLAPMNVRFATFNLSFDRIAAGVLSAELAMTRAKQDTLIARLNAGQLKNEEKSTAQRVQQIRNVAEIIQRNRPDVFVLNEFDNDGSGNNSNDLAAFNTNYLAHAQSDDVKGISYPVRQTFATNTGLMSNFDLNLDGKIEGPDDAWGFGNYHGQYAFAVMSRFPIESDKIRTFQKFKWKDMPGESNPIIDDCENSSAPIPANRICGEEWYDDDAWQALPLSSKNHVDLPIRITAPSGQPTTVHFLLSHPTPPIYGNAARHNVKRNRAEVAFWNDYISGENYMVDDKGVYGGLASNAKFVIAGDLNADPITGDGDLSAINDLYNSSFVNPLVSNGYLIPTSEGGPECLADPTLCKRNNIRPFPERITSSSGLQLDHVIPSANLNTTASGVFWPASYQTGYHLVYAQIDGAVDIAKKVSSDHRLVWIDFTVD